ncbi:MAG TPA: hypothetical protein DCO75_12045, partial [Fibrobacteres bacterium]|nr:hypothetical protein [Fibrobacterota bacterium]
MRTLLCLLSGQHVPNLLAVHHFSPDRLVLIETIGMKKKHAAENFLEALKAGNIDYSGHNDIIHLEKEDDFPVIRSCMEKIYNLFPADEWIVVLTGGTKPMAICAYEFFYNKNQHCIYTNVDSPEKIMDVKTGKTEECKYRISIKEFLAGYGFGIDGNCEKNEKQNEKWWECSRIIAENEADFTFLASNDEERNVARNHGYDLQSDIISKTAIVSDSIASAFEVLNNSGKITGKIDKYQAQFLTGGWLETFIWGLLKKHQDILGIYDVRLGLKVKGINTTTNNDFDVCFMKNNSLSMIECKSGTQGNDKAGDILYKVEALIRQFRALRVNTCIVTTGTNLFDDKGKLKQNIKDRTAIYNARL